MFHFDYWMSFSVVWLALFGLLCLFPDIQFFAHSPALQQLEISGPTMPRARSAHAIKKCLDAAWLNVSLSGRSPFCELKKV